MLCKICYFFALLKIMEVCNVAKEKKSSLIERIVCIRTIILSKILKKMYCDVYSFRKCFLYLLLTKIN